MNILPDIASELKAEKSAALQWVGMEGIAVPISVNLSGDQYQTISAKANVFVSLEKSMRKAFTCLAYIKRSTN